MIHSSAKILIQAILNQVEKVEMLCADPDVPPDLLVHEVRKSFKRLVAFLKFYPDETAALVSEHSKNIKSLARLLTLARESAVNLMLGDRLLEAGFDFSEETKNQLRNKLENENQNFISELFEQRKILPQIEQLMRSLKVDLLPRLSDSDVPIRFKPKLTASYLKAFEQYGSVRENYDPVEFHELRKLLKTLYYQFEVAIAGNEVAMLAESEGLDKLTELLGEDHDWYVFRRELESGFLDTVEADREKIGTAIHLFKDANFKELEAALEAFFLDQASCFPDRLEILSS